MIENTRMRLKKEVKESIINEWLSTFAESISGISIKVPGDTREDCDIQTENARFQRYYFQNIPSDGRVLASQLYIHTEETEMSLSLIFHVDKRILFVETNLNYNADEKFSELVLELYRKITENATEDAGIQPDICPHVFDKHYERVLYSMANETASSCLPVIVFTPKESHVIPADPGWFAERLACRAHVIVIEDTTDAKRIADKTGNKIQCNGIMNIILPDGKTVLRYGSAYLKDEEKARREIVKTLSIQFRPVKVDCLCRWEQIVDYRLKQSALSKTSSSLPIEHKTDDYEKLIKISENETEKWKKKYEELENQYNLLNIEIERLKELYSDKEDGIFLKKTEVDYYEGEIKDTVLTVLENAALTCQFRRNHILQDLIDNNEKVGKSTEIREDILAAFKKDPAVNIRLKNNLAKANVSITAENKHFKAIWNNDPRYMITLPKSPSKMNSYADQALTIIRTIM